MYSQVISLYSMPSNFHRTVSLRFSPSAQNPFNVVTADTIVMHCTPNTHSAPVRPISSDVKYRYEFREAPVVSCERKAVSNSIGTFSIVFRRPNDGSAPEILTEQFASVRRLISADNALPSECIRIGRHVA